MLNFLLNFFFLDHSEGGVDIYVNALKKFIINRFHQADPQSRIMLSLIDDIIIKLHNKIFEKTQDDMYSVRGNVWYMLSFEKLVEENPAGNDDGESEKM